MVGDRLCEIRIEGMRTLEDVRLPLHGLTVLIGDNGSGKSSIVEACRLIGKLAEPDFFKTFNGVHGGLASLLRFGASRLSLGIRIEGSAEPIQYQVDIAKEGNFAVLEQERLQLGPMPGQETPLQVIHRTRSRARVFDREQRKLIEPPFEVERDQLILTAYGRMPPQPAITRVQDCLRQIEVHLGFDTLPNWASRSLGRPSPLRDPVLHEPAEAVALFGRNLANVFSALKNDFSKAHWDETMDYVRLGLGDEVESINTRVDPGGGAISLRVKYAQFDQQVPALALSDGTLAYLAFVALFRLETRRSLLAFDEPELHLHPHLLMRVLDFFESLSREHPVLLATHSDRLLDGLSDPACSAVLCLLDPQRSTRLVRPEAEQLEAWLSRYRGLGDIRSAGHERSVMTQPAP
jgi:predicted ATPase